VPNEGIVESRVPNRAAWPCKAQELLRFATKADPNGSERRNRKCLTDNTLCQFPDLGSTVAKGGLHESSQRRLIYDCCNYTVS
jgi:hypothetical protein